MNVLPHTLVAGGLLWLYGLSVNAGRAARGNAAVFVWIVLWAFVTALVVLTARRRQLELRRGPDRPASPARRLVPLRDVALTVAVAAFALLVGVDELAGDFGLHHRGRYAALTLCALPFMASPLIMAPLAAWLRRTLRTTPRPEVTLPSPGAYVLALLPMLAPAALLAWLFLAPVPAHLADVIAGNGLAGIGFLQLETLALPAALIVACGLDTTDGSRGRWPYAAWVVGVSVVALVLTAALPVAVEPEGMHSPVRLRDDWRVPDELPPLGLLRGTSVLMLVCSLASGAILWGMGRRRVAAAARAG